MGISFSIPCDPCINKSFQCLDKKVDYTHNLEKNLVALETNMRELKARRDDLVRRVTREEDRGLQRLAEIQVWVTTVETIEKKVNDLSSNKNVQLPRLCLFGLCSKSLKLSYQYGKSVFLTMKEVEKLKASVFEVVAEKPQTSEVEEIQLQRLIVGQETMLEKAWNHLMDDGVDIMGMYGMGGVGKTTLLTQLNNKFSNVRCGFDFVIWIVVSKELHLEKIRDEIAQKVGLGGNKKEIIYNFLRKKRFVLFLDDIWEKVDLAEIGVPFPTTENKCKVAFTTRLQDVCGQMGVEDPMGVTCLSENDAFDLFAKKVGQRTLGSDPEIPELAKIIAAKCSGLPLALNVIGETMSYRTKKQEWLHARDVLNSYASEFSGMEDKILPLLKYSYDNLKGEEVKSCLLYCALFPEDYKIGKERLIDYWICEGIIDGTKGLEWAENKGYEIIGSLVRASLLMDELTSKGRDVVHMHDVVREMALWIASDLGKQKEAFIVRAGVGLRGVPKVENWKVVKRMSLMENKIQQLVGSPECLELTTLLLQRMNLAKISSDEFFKFMPKLAVLDLSKNRNLCKLPNGISELVSLQYLNLSNTGIRRLPVGIQELKKLTHLDLERTRMLSSFAGISNLHNLKVLKLAVEEYFYSALDLEEVEELETLEHLQVLTLSTSRPQVLERYLSSPRLTSCTRELQIKYLEPSGGISLPVTMEKLCEFRIFRCNISEIKIVQNPRIICFSSLSNVVIRSCHFLKELTFLMFAPNLKVLDVCDSKQLKEIINKDKACEGGESGMVPFPNLISLHLRYLPSLKSIYWRPLPFSCLKEINVEGCPHLENLPLTHGENGLHIQEE